MYYIHTQQLFFHLSLLQGYYINLWSALWKIAIFFYFNFLFCSLRLDFSRVNIRIWLRKAEKEQVMGPMELDPHQTHKINLVICRFSTFPIMSCWSQLITKETSTTKKSLQQQCYNCSRLPYNHCLVFILSDSCIWKKKTLPHSVLHYFPHK